VFILLAGNLRFATLTDGDAFDLIVEEILWNVCSI
jgi:hypothetical protein